MDSVVISLIVSLVINITMFVIAFRLQSDKLTDASYAVTFLTLTVFGFIISDGSAYHVLLATMLAVWAFRLGGFLLYRVIRAGKDRRFDGMRENFVKFGTFWLIQAVSVWVLMIPSVLAFELQVGLAPLAVLGVLIWLVGFLVESVADAQKNSFTSNKANRGKWIESGMWKYSRHPNYFGEILVWLGVYVYATASFSPALAVLASVSPLFITVLLLFVSGIPILEKAADKRWGKNTAYQAYKKRTSILLPLPPRT